MSHPTILDRSPVADWRRFAAILLAVGLSASPICNLGASAQETTPNDVDKQTDRVPASRKRITENARKGDTVKRSGNSWVPDISGTWIVGKEGSRVRVIRKLKDGTGDFEILSNSGGDSRSDQKVKWSSEGHRFEGVKASIDQQRSMITTLVLFADRNTMQVTYRFDDQSMAELRKRRPDLDVIRSEEWTRQGNDSTFPAWLSSPDAQTLTKQLADYEAKANTSAHRIKNLAKDADSEKLERREVVLKRELETTLHAALVIKLKLEQLQIQALEERLTQLKTQIVERQAVSNQIVERRLNELIGRDVLRWDSTPTAQTSTSPQTGGDDTEVSDNEPISAPTSSLVIQPASVTVPSAAKSGQNSDNTGKMILDFIRDEAFASVDALATLQFAFEVKDDQGWHSNAEFFADKVRFRVNRQDVKGMQVSGQRPEAMRVSSAFDGVQQQYCVDDGPVGNKMGVDGASYSITTPQQFMYAWLLRSPGDFRFDSLLEKEMWDQRFAEATYVGAIPANGETLEIVDFPQNWDGLKPCTYRVFFSRDAGFVPIKYIRRIAATTEASTTLEVTDLKKIELPERRAIGFPMTLKYTETGVDGVSRKQTQSMTIHPETLRVNEPIDESVFTIQ